jgi:hypothetical protein
MMDSAMIAKISKAREYASEPERITFNDFTVLFTGKHQTYRVGFEHGAWKCECDFFAQRGVCSHVMAVEKVLNRAGTSLAQPEPVQA